MKKLRIYLDTSVISHLDAPDTPEKMGDTRKLWEDIKADKYEVFISDVTLGELKGCPEPKRSRMYEALSYVEYTVVERSRESLALSVLYTELGGLPPKSKDDALHIAVASIFGCDIIASWNFKHIVNLRAMTAVEVANVKEGYRTIRILSPSMLLESEE